MNLLPLEKLDSREEENSILKFGIFLPLISEKKGYKLFLKIKHNKDQFIKKIPDYEFEMNYTYDTQFGDYWSVSVDLKTTKKLHPDSAWGTKGLYIYRFYLTGPDAANSKNMAIDWILDPFTKEFGVGKFSGITVGHEDYKWSSNENKWKTPFIKDLVFYELQINEFAGDINGLIEKLDYLVDLGINCLEIMPLNNVELGIDWGYLPIGLFGVDERFGTNNDFKLFIDEAHKRGIAVILDVVYGHTGHYHPYCYVYKELGYAEDPPFIGKFSKDYFGESTNFNKIFVQDYYFTLNMFWLENFHLDGFRYDCVPNYWSDDGTGYKDLVYYTYNEVKKKEKLNNHWQKFFNEGCINLIQCAEQLEDPQGVLYDSYSNCTWQNLTLDLFKDLAHSHKDSLTALGRQLGLNNYPDIVKHNNDVIHKTALHYLETHDHKRFLCEINNISPYNQSNELLFEGNRTVWFKLQPYYIALFSAKGIPMLWMGQEIAENYYVPEGLALGRVKLFRPIRWDYYFDNYGSNIFSLIQKMLYIRKKNIHFRRGDYRFYDNYLLYQDNNIIMFSRYDKNFFSLIAVNFDDSDHNVPFEFPYKGNYNEELNGEDNLVDVKKGEKRILNIPSNYGKIWTIKYK